MTQKSQRRRYQSELLAFIFDTLRLSALPIRRDGRRFCSRQGRSRGHQDG